MAIVTGVTEKHRRKACARGGRGKGAGLIIERGRQFCPIRLLSRTFLRHFFVRRVMATHVFFFFFFLNNGHLYPAFTPESRGQRQAAVRITPALHFRFCNHCSARFLFGLDHGVSFFSLNRGLDQRGGESCPPPPNGESCARIWQYNLVERSS